MIFDDERAKLSRAAEEARREAWPWFGGFSWVWLVSMLATGAVIGALAMAWIQGRGDAREFGLFPRIYCGTAGGQVVEQDNGSATARFGSTGRISENQSGQCCY